MTSLCYFKVEWQISYLRSKWTLSFKNAKKGLFRHFLKVDNDNLVSENFFKDLMYAIGMQNMFKPIRAINHTDS